MALSCSSRLAKYILFFFNVIFWVCGAAILGVGIWVLVDKNALDLLNIASIDASDSLVKGAAVSLVVVGVVVFITGFLGCCGAVKESPCMLMMYAVIVGIILLIQIIAGIMGAVFKDQIESGLADSMNKTVLERYNQSKYEGLTDAWDFMQQEFHCCGAIDGPSDWENSMWHKDQTNSSVTVPKSCCVYGTNSEPKDIGQCYLAAYNQTFPSREDYIYTEGCKPALTDWVKNHAAIIIGVAFGLAAVQVLAIIMSCCLRSSVKSQYETV